jgi:catechol O-methyltransferase
MPEAVSQTVKKGVFDPSKAYAAQEGTTFFNDGREIELLHFVYSHPKLGSIRGSPESVLDAIDEYARTRKYLMNVGEDKGRIVCDLIAEVKPKTMVCPSSSAASIPRSRELIDGRIQVELGGYVGYSSILFGAAVRAAGGSRYYSLEMNPEFAAVIMVLVDLAGLSDVVKVIIGPSDVSIARLYESGALSHIDLLFLDHYKPAYTTDLKLCEELKLVTPGSVLAADNVIKPGNPPYLEYVRRSVDEKRKHLGVSTNGGGLPGKTVDQYKDKTGFGQMKLSQSRGNPNLIYESRLVESFEPTGVPVRDESGETVAWRKTNLRIGRG